MSYDPARTASFYDAYGEREWTRFDDGRTPSVSLAVHGECLRRFVRAGDRVLEVGAGPGRFTIELSRIGASVVDGHLDMRLFRWSDLRELLASHGEVVAASAAGLFRADPAEPDVRELVGRLELELAAEPGAVDCGPHMLAVLRTAV